MRDNKYEILIVDDSKLFQKSIENIIKSDIDCIIHKALESKEAIKILRNNDIDLILLDINLPGKDGFETAKIIMQDKRTSNIPIIFITGIDPYQELKEKGFNLGAVDYLIKPFQNDELIRLIKLYFRFIKHERESNKKLIELTNELQEEIDRRKVVEKALKKSEKELKEIIATKDRLFSIIAHDLKNPLGAFKELTKVIIEEYKNISPDDFFTMIKELNHSAQSVFQLLENLLDWSRSQLGQININPIEFDITFIINQTFELLRLSANKKQINLISKVDMPLLVYADINMITTVIRNLVSNAIKFTKEGGEIIISKAEIDEDSFTGIVVRDTGIGMDEEQVKKLFDINTIVSNPGTHQEQGTGLGLIICKEFVEKNNGSIEVFSKKGVGTEFIIKLPKSR